MKKIVYLNTVPEELKKHTNYIKEVIADFYNQFELNCKLEIEFIEYKNLNEFEITDCMIRSKSVKDHKLMITNSLLRSIDFDGGIFFTSSIYHEFEHIDDFNKMMATKLFKKNPTLTRQKSIEEVYMSKGYLFWTEINSYFYTIKFCSLNKISFGKIPFSNLVSNYIKTININKNLYYKKDLTIEEVENYINVVDSFIYLCAKFMASFYANHSRIPYSKIKKDKVYKKVFNILLDLDPKVRRLLYQPYCENSYINLFKLGLCICKNIRFKIFRLGFIKKRRKIVTIY